MRKAVFVPILFLVLMSASHSHAQDDDSYVSLWLSGPDAIVFHPTQATDVVLILEVHDYSDPFQTPGAVTVFSDPAHWVPLVTLVDSGGVGWSCSGSSAFICEYTGTLTPGVPAAPLLLSFTAPDWLDWHSTNLCLEVLSDQAGIFYGDGHCMNVHQVRVSDLQMVVTGPDSWRVDGDATYTARVLNAGPSSVYEGDVEVVASGAGGWIVGSAGSGWSCVNSASDGSATCSYDASPLDAGASTPPLAFDVAHTGAIGDFNFCVSINEFYDDPDHSNNEDCKTTALKGATSLAVGQDVWNNGSPDGAGEVYAGEAFTYGIYLGNNARWAGYADALDVVVTNQLPPGVELIGVTATGPLSCDTTESGMVTCAADVLPPGDYEIEMSVIAPPHATTLINTCGVKTSTYNSTPSARMIAGLS